MSRKKIHHPFDFAFGVMYNEFPKELHENLDIPGVFRRKSNVKVRLKNGTILEMDASYVVDPDFERLLEPAVVILEHQSKAVDMPKIQIIGYYEIQKIADERLPPLSVIASHLSSEKSVQEFDRTPTSTTKLLFLDLGAEENQKRLNRLKNIINYNEEQLTIKDALNLGIVVLFAQREIAPEVTRQAIELYLKIDAMPKKLEYTLYSVLYAMIDAYFDDENEYEELVNMINNETADEIVGKFESEIISQNKIFELEKELDGANSRADSEASRADSEALRADSEALRADSEASRADNAEAENRRLKDEIEMLKSQLNFK